nr:alpha-hydroxy acid oxidase [Sphingomonas sp. LaA6.9]
MLTHCHNIEDLRIAARKRAHRMVFDYIDGAADDEAAMRNNGHQFSGYDLVHRVLTGVDQVDTSTTLLGRKIDIPFIISPSAGNRLFHTQGERAVARAASEFGTIYSLSTLSTVSIEEIGRLTSGPKWFQLYVWKDRGLVKEMLARARMSGFEALILTVDMPITGNRERDLHNRFTIPPKITPAQIWHALRAPRWTADYLMGPAIRYANLSADTPAISLAAFVAGQLHAGFNWRDAEWLLGEWNGPSVIKGVVDTDDAAKAVSTGFNAIAISNHGGRQLDASPAPIDMLPPIADKVGDAAELIVDGGIRRSTDILKSLALGARAVSFARPYLYGLAAGGQQGVTRALDLFTTSLRRDMVLLGVQSISELNRDFVRRRA